MRTLLILILILTLSLGCVPAQKSGDPPVPESGPPASRPSSQPADLHAAFDEILQRHVRDERVDYLGIRRERWPALVGYLDRIAEVNVDRLSRDARLALYLNLYNATMIRAVLERFRAGYSPSEKSFGIFDEKRVRVGGKTLSLNQLEHEIIRPEFAEPRIHVALVCAARSCPPLLPRSYRAADLDAVLQAKMERFVNAPFRNRVDRQKKRLELSQIFNWYAEDFGGAAGVPRYVSRFLRGGGAADYEVGFIDYSWALNIAPPAGRWVTVITAAPLRQARGAGDTADRAPSGAVFAVLQEKDGWFQVERPFGASPAWLRVAETAPYRG